ncbi:hypothetical protein MLOOGBEN_17095 [Bacillus sp. EB106-08-02-XG196]|uniref:hypothetical protein n=1 Tax=Bacillus sp. EB106-08-02-XG196 TaxID=2737049 RepID=UPI0015C44470|nr:hypothetical protein [Bacillus sp. EB106-08-02-XG196]NWQ42420.1 hypothetical protein [Bacillus sp. EB106-08-02-XG196]
MEFNSYMYLGLGILSILLLIYVYIKTRNSRSLLLFVTMVGLGYLIEAVIYNFAHSYQYYPKLIKHDSFYDSNLGAIASNALTLPAIATFIAILRKNWIWIIVLVILIAGIEWTFLKLNIYSHNWWKIGYTSLGLLVYFPLAKVFHQLLSNPLKGFLHTIFLFLIVGPFSGSLHIMPIMFLSNRYYELGWYESHSQDTTAFSAIFYVGACLFYVWIAKQHWKLKWLKYVLTPLLMYTVNVLLQKAGILHSQVWWDPWYYVILSVILLKLTVSMGKHLSSGLSKNT